MCKTKKIKRKFHRDNICANDFSAFTCKFRTNILSKIQSETKWNLISMGYNNIQVEHPA